MTVATVANMRRFQHPALRMLDSFGNEFSATPGDYFWMPDDEVFTDEAGEPCVLVVNVCKHVDVAEIVAPR